MKTMIILINYIIYLKIFAKIKIMELLNINLDKIELKHFDEFYKVIYNQDCLRIKFNNIKALFGIENEYKNLILKLLIENTNDREKLNQINEKISSILNKSVKNQLREDNVLICKIPRIKNKITTEIKDKNGYYNIYNISKNQYINCELYLDTIWKFNDKYYYKWNYKKIYVIQ